MLDDGTRARLESHDQAAQSPAIWAVTLRVEDYQTLRAALAAAEAARDELRIDRRVVASAGITHFDQTGSPAATITRLQEALAVAEQARDKYQALWCGAARMVREERERATRLEALATAAREVDAARTARNLLASDLSIADGSLAMRDAIMAEEAAADALHDAVANLAAPPEETGAADAP